ncbi:dihydrofolate reductase family protein [Nocardioides sp.]|uniref:dihydrofolate reductase family protein n=1 Tax=Nocardioides sp. TaxID=35761 RepID=UPI001A28E4BD|nr:dihydrofolate reductase family protein [Nocardioides sp.]MBJ7357688.1 dihydrofolate reductase family protein [Nocardioides sp.]
MRVLVGSASGPSDLAGLYAAPRTPWLRVNMVSSVDGAATGESGKSGSINNAADKVVFDTLRSLADAVVVGAGTLRDEGYRPIAGTPLVAVSRRGSVPPRLRDAAPGSVLMATCAAAEGLAEARSVLGAEHVLVAGDDSVDLALVVAALHDRGLTQLLSEGGPTLLASLLAADLVDELDATVVPRLVGGSGPRIVTGPPVEVPLTLHTLLEEGGTLLARWLTPRGAD